MLTHLISMNVLVATMEKELVDWPVFFNICRNLLWNESRLEELVFFRH